VSVVAQFTWGISLFALVPFVFMRRISREARDWLIVTAVAFLSLTAFHSLTVIFLIFQWPKLDVQTLFIGRVQYIQSHAIFAIWISYGLIFALVYLDRLLRGNRAAAVASCAVVASLSAVPVLKNAYDDNFIALVGGAEQNEHDFGWQFGAWQLEGARAILSEIGEEEKAAFPNPNYPPAHDHQRRVLRRHRPRPFRAHLHDLLGALPLRCVPDHAERAGRQHLHERDARPVRRLHLDPVPAGQQLRVPEVRAGRAGGPHPRRARP
jgi:hypothetical protein